MPMWRYGIAPVLFVLSYLGARVGLKAVEPGSGAAFALALLPVPFFALLIWIYMRLVRSMDELAIRIQLEALSLAYPIALLAVFTAGLFELAGFDATNNWDLPRLCPLLLLPYWFGLWRAQRRYA